MKLSQTEKDKYGKILLTYRIEKHGTNELTYRTKKNYRYRKQGYQEVNMGGINLFTEQKKSYRYRKQSYGYQEVKAGGINWRLGLTCMPYYIQ